MSDEIPWWEVYQSLGFMSAPRQTATLQAWAHLFDTEGRTNEEMVQVVYAIARRDKLPSFAEEHLQAIREELRRMDYERSMVAPVVINRARCPYCGDCGIVCGLPHSHHITHEGLWDATIGKLMYTQCAKCDRCNVGRSIGGSMLTLTQYERDNPHWQMQLDFYAQYMKSNRQAWQAARKDPCSQYPETAADAKSAQKLEASVKKILARTAHEGRDHGRERLG